MLLFSTSYVVHIVISTTDSFCIRARILRSGIGTPNLSLLSCAYRPVQPLVLLGPTLILDTRSFMRMYILPSYVPLGWTKYMRIQI